MLGSERFGVVEEFDENMNISREEKETTSL